MICKVLQYYTVEWQLFTCDFQCSFDPVWLIMHHKQSALLNIVTHENAAVLLVYKVLSYCVNLPSSKWSLWVLPQVGFFPPHVSSGARPPVPQPSSSQQPVLVGPPGSQRTQVCVYMLFMCMHVGVLVSGCGVALYPVFISILKSK